jgi:hypothetical protein
MKVAQIEYSPLWKVLRKCVPKRSFGLPKSSFGEHRLYKMITKDSSMRINDAMCWFSGMLRSFVTTLQDDYKIITTCDVLVFWDATIFCNNFARWVKKIVGMRGDVLVFLGCYRRVPLLPVLTNPPFHEFLKHFNHDLWFTIFGNSWRIKDTGERCGGSVCDCGFLGSRCNVKWFKWKPALESHRASITRNCEMINSCNV